MKASIWGLVIDSPGAPGLRTASPVGCSRHCPDSVSDSQPHTAGTFGHRAIAARTSLSIIRLLKTAADLSASVPQDVIAKYVGQCGEVGLSRRPKGQIGIKCALYIGHFVYNNGLPRVCRATSLQGAMAEWLCSGLQIRVRWFYSVLRLQYRAAVHHART